MIKRKEWVRSRALRRQLGCQAGVLCAWPALPCRGCLAARQGHFSTWVNAVCHSQGTAQAYSIALFVRQKEIIKGAIKIFPPEPVLDPHTGWVCSLIQISGSVHPVLIIEQWSVWSGSWLQWSGGTGLNTIWDMAPLPETSQLPQPSLETRYSGQCQEASVVDPA